MVVLPTMLVDQHLLGLAAAGLEAVTIQFRHLLLAHLAVLPAILLAEQVERQAGH